MKRTRIFWIVTGIIISVLGVAYLVRWQERTEAEAEFFEVAGWVGRPLSVTVKPENWTQFVQRVNQIHEHRQWRPKDAALAMVWSDIHKDAEVCFAIISRAAKEGNKSIFDEVIYEWLKQDDLRKAVAQLNTSIGALASVAVNLSEREIRDGTKVDYRSAWHGVFPEDAIAIKNSASVDLEDAAVFVTLRDTSGNFLTNVHYTERWQPGANLYAEYLYLDSEYQGARTLEDVVGVDVAVYSKAGKTQTSYQLSQERWDEIVKGYCDQIHLHYQFLDGYVEDETRKPYPPGFKFSFVAEDLGKLPVRRVHIRFVNNKSSEEVSFDENAMLTANKPYPLRSWDLTGFSSEFPPTQQELTLEFAGPFVSTCKWSF